MSQMDSSKSYALLDIDPPAIMTRRKALLISVASCDHAQLERRYEVGSGRDSQHTWIPSFKKSYLYAPSPGQAPMRDGALAVRAMSEVLVCLGKTDQMAGMYLPAMPI
ncbi:hypothetical protein KEM48_010777 [Puccinia striiformis f. sp. tritici PST-130]|nr:hypothetical protein KEM48_010777 [Puccinia striiformis f. sp. tritici PST-130]